MLRQVNERGEGREDMKKRKVFPSSPTPSFIFWLSFHFSRDQNRKSRSSAGSLVFLCSETTRKRLLRGLGHLQGAPVI